MMGGVMTASRVVLASLSLIAISAASTPAASFPADRLVDTCQGMAATIVGGPDVRKLTGTPGPDVIVSAGSALVKAGPGDDLVCVTGPATLVSAGSGADVVSTSDGDHETRTNLGPGADRFSGGNRRDTIVQVSTTGAEVDRIDTGAGADVYRQDVPQPVAPEGPAPDNALVDLGAGPDLAWLTASNLGGSLDGGSGLNTLSVYDSIERDYLPWTFDNVIGAASFNGVVQYHWSGFRGFTFPWSGPISFQGSGAAEVVRASASESGGPRFTLLDMAGGDDRVVMYDMNAPLRGGDGTDTLRLLGFGDARLQVPARPAHVDLQRGLVSLSGAGTDEVVDVENVEVDGFLIVELIGSEAANRFVVGRACETTMHGAAGADRLSATPGSACRPGGLEPAGVTRGVFAFGEGGNDLLEGRATADQLVGGPGDDTVDGKGGIDACSAELALRCEVTMTRDRRPG